MTGQCRDYFSLSCSVVEWLNSEMNVCEQWDEHLCVCIFLHLCNYMHTPEFICTFDVCMSVGGQVCPVCMFVHAYVCLFQCVCVCVCPVRGDQLSLSSDRNQVSEDMVSPCHLQLLLLGGHVCFLCVCVSFSGWMRGCVIPLLRRLPIEADCMDDTHGRVPGVNLR